MTHIGVFTSLLRRHVPHLRIRLENNAHELGEGQAVLLSHLLIMLYAVLGTVLHARQLSHVLRALQIGGVLRKELLGFFRLRCYRVLDQGLCLRRALSPDILGEYALPLGLVRVECEDLRIDLFPVAQILALGTLLLVHVLLFLGPHGLFRCALLLGLLIGREPSLIGEPLLLVYLGELLQRECARHRKSRLRMGRAILRTHREERLRLRQGHGSFVRGFSDLLGLHGAYEHLCRGRSLDDSFVDPARLCDLRRACEADFRLGGGISSGERKEHDYRDKRDYSPRLVLLHVLETVREERLTPVRVESYSEREKQAESSETGHAHAPQEPHDSDRIDI